MSQTWTGSSFRWKLGKVSWRTVPWIKRLRAGGSWTFGFRYAARWKKTNGIKEGRCYLQENPWFLLYEYHYLGKISHFAVYLQTESNNIWRVPNECDFFDLLVSTVWLTNHLEVWSGFGCWRRWNQLSCMDFGLKVTWLMLRSSWQII